MSVNFTVAIRTFNGEKRLPDVLDELLHQETNSELRWEVLVIDNNSQDQTAKVVDEYVRKWNQIRTDSYLRYVFEPRQGSSYPRDRAMQEAASPDLVGFLDDDNLPARDWVVEAYRFGQAHPRVGAYGSRIYAKLDEPAPPHFEGIKSFLAVNDWGPNTFHFTKKYPRQVPVGPGCVIRKQAWQEAVPRYRRLRGRDDNSRFKAAHAEDVEIMYYIQSSNWEVWHNSLMSVWHHIPVKRMDKTYLRKLAFNSGLAAHACRYAKLSPQQRRLMPLLIPGYLLLSTIRVVKQYLQQRNQFATDFGKECSFQRNIGVLLSCFFTPAPKSYDDASAANSRSSISNPPMGPAARDLRSDNGSLVTDQSPAETISSESHLESSQPLLPVLGYEVPSGKADTLL